MLYPRASSSRIIGTGSYFPERVITNADFEKMVDTSDEWIRTRTGIRERRFCAEDQACSDLCVEASKRAIEMAAIDPLDIDAIIVGTVTGDMQFPATGVFVQDRIGAKNAVAFDLSAACSGFIFGVHTAHAYILSGQARRVLVLGAETLSKFVDMTDRSTCVLFGDAAGAALMEGCESGQGILATHMGSDGSLAELLCIPAGGSRSPLTPDTYATNGQYIRMKGDGVFKWAVRAMADAAANVIEQGGFSLSDIAVMIPHQANIRIIDAVVERLGMDPARVPVTLDRFGNTSAATIPTALDEAVRTGRIKDGDLVVLAGFGGGFTWGATLMRFSLARNAKAPGRS